LNIQFNNEEVGALKKRKEYEKKLIAELEKLKLDDCNSWFAVSMDWIKSWKTFVSNKGEYPGPINNYNLYQEDRTNEVFL
jgi:hypothetical protein